MPATLITYLVTSPAMQGWKRSAMLCRYTDIFVGQPQVEEDYITSSITPQQCRLRDMTYAAPITVDVEYTRGKEIVVRKGKDGVGAVYIGRIPLMLRCDRSAGPPSPFALLARCASEAFPTVDCHFLRDVRAISSRAVSTILDRPAWRKVRSVKEGHHVPARMSGVFLWPGVY